MRTAFLLFSGQFLATSGEEVRLKNLLGTLRAKFPLYEPEQVKAFKLNCSLVNMSSEVEKVGQEQIHDLLFEEKLSWQSIIYDLINTEQLNPWDINIAVLSQKYLERVRELEEANFFISSKVLLAASLL
jgi:hypothetical protein